MSGLILSKLLGIEKSSKNLEMINKITLGECQNVVKGDVMSLYEGKAYKSNYKFPPEIINFSKDVINNASALNSNGSFNTVEYLEPDVYMHITGVLATPRLSIVKRTDNEIKVTSFIDLPFSIVNYPNNVRILKLSEGIVALVYYETGIGLKACTVEYSQQQIVRINNPTLIDSYADSAGMRLAELRYLSPNSLVVYWANAMVAGPTWRPKAVVLTVSGQTIVMGVTKTLFVDAGVNGIGIYLHPVGNSGSKFCAFVNYSSLIEAQIFTVSGTTITSGTKINLITDTNNLPSITDIYSDPVSELLLVTSSRGSSSHITKMAVSALTAALTTIAHPGGYSAYNTKIVPLKEGNSRFMIFTITYGSLLCHLYTASTSTFGALITTIAGGLVSGGSTVTLSSFDVLEIDSGHISDTRLVVLFTGLTMLYTVVVSITTGVENASVSNRNQISNGGYVFKLAKTSVGNAVFCLGSRFNALLWCSDSKQMVFKRGFLPIGTTRKSIRILDIDATNFIMLYKGYNYVYFKAIIGERKSDGTLDFAESSQDCIDGSYDISDTPANRVAFAIVGEYLVMMTYRQHASNPSYNMSYRAAKIDLITKTIGTWSNAVATTATVTPYTYLPTLYTIPDTNEAIAVAISAAGVNTPYYGSILVNQSTGAITIQPSTISTTVPNQAMATDAPPEIHRLPDGKLMLVCPYAANNNNNVRLFTYNSTTLTFTLVSTLTYTWNKVCFVPQFPNLLFVTHADGTVGMYLYTGTDFTQIGTSASNVTYAVGESTVIPISPTEFLRIGYLTGKGLVAEFDALANTKTFCTQNNALWNTSGIPIPFVKMDNTKKKVMYCLDMFTLCVSRITYDSNTTKQDDLSLSTLGVALGTFTEGQQARIQQTGVVKAFSNLIPGYAYDMDKATNKVAISDPRNIKIGVAISDSELMLVNTKYWEKYTT